MNQPVDAIQNLIQSVTGTVGPFLPRLVGALVILIITWIIASVVKLAVAKIGAQTNLDQRLGSVGLSKTFADVLYWIVWLVALPSLLGTLQLDSLLAPVNALVTQILGAVPKLLSAAVILGIGYLIARVIQKIVSSLLNAAGSEKLAARFGLTDSFGKDGLAGLAGLVVFLLVFLPVLSSGLAPLGLEAATKPIDAMLVMIADLLPKLIAAGVIILIAVLIGRIIANIVSGALKGFGFDRAFTWLGLSADTKIIGQTPSGLIGTVIFASLVLAAVTQASQVMGMAILTDAIASFGTIIAQVAGGALILAIGLWLANLAASALAGRGNLSLLARVAVLFFVIPLALRQMGLPTEIITLGFGGIIGALTIAAALAFGLGGRDAAARVLDSAADNLGLPK